MLKSAEKNNDMAQYNLGYSIYEAGSEESLYWLNKAAENNNLQAIMYLSLIHIFYGNSSTIRTH